MIIKESMQIFDIQKSYLFYTNEWYNKIKSYTKIIINELKNINHNSLIFNILVIYSRQS